MRGVRRLLRSAQRLVPPSRGGATVLAYHLVGGGTGGAVDLEPEVFRSQMEELSATAHVVPLGEIVAGSAADDRADRKPLVAITFDDAYANFFEQAWPVLEELALPATLFVPVGFLDRTHPAPIRGTEHLPAAAWDDLAAAVADPLLDVGSHSWSHGDLRRLPDADLDRELAASRRRLSERLETAVTSFCYPRAWWDRRVERRVAGEYAQAVIGGGRAWTPSQSPWRIQRVSLRRDGPRSLAQLLAAPVWLEEWVADRARRLRPARGGTR